MKITRTEKWLLRTTPQDRAVFLDTVRLYQRYVRALSSVCFTHWSTFGTMEGNEVIRLMEALIHPTKQRPIVKYPYFHKVFYKFPSYLRRSAIMDAVGQVRSFLNRYDQWQTFEARKTKKQKPPRFGVSNTYPDLYRGQCIKYSDDFSIANIKVFENGDWVWRSVRIKGSSKRLKSIIEKINSEESNDSSESSIQKMKSPQLVVSGKKATLSVPFERKVTLFNQKAERVCSVDLGINTQITASIVQKDGTVLSRIFLNRGNDMDRMHKRLSMIQKASRKTKKLGKGFCANWYRKAYAILKESAHSLTRQFVEFAHLYGATTLVFEHMQGWRPKAPKKGLRQRFHTWLHRRVVEFSEWKWREYGGRLAFVSPKHTSKYAYDGSGEVTRSPGIKGVKHPYDMCRFQSGKYYNTDLNATYNIAAKYFLRDREVEQLDGTKVSLSKSGIPITLSLLWKNQLSA